MDRVILHSDINSCYASIELLYHPHLRGRPLAVGGSQEDRHGIILAKEELAKRCGVRTGMTIWQAKRLCPELVVLPPRMDLYIKFSQDVQKIYAEYTDLKEPFGIDECWLDLTGCVAPEKGEAVAIEIGNRVKKDMGVTVSIGVSWNKVFAKLGSDYKKPDAVTVIDRAGYKNIVWPLPVKELLYVGPSTSKKLRAMGIDTIGRLAAADPEALRLRLGKMGLVIHSFANGLDDSPVLREDLVPPIKSMGNSTTTPRDLVNDREVQVTLTALAESVGMRLRENGFMGRTVEISVRDSSLHWRSRQSKLPYATDITREIADISFGLFKSLHVWPTPVRSLGIRCTELVSANFPEQLSLFSDHGKRDRQRQLDRVMDDIRRRHGFEIIQRAAVFQNGGAYKGACSLPGAL